MPRLFPAFQESPKSDVDSPRGAKLCFHSQASPASFEATLNHRRYEKPPPGLCCPAGNGLLLGSVAPRDVLGTRSANAGVLQ